MVQTTGALSFTKARVFISDDVGVSWKDVTSYGASIAIGGGERAGGEQNTYDGPIPVIKAGKRAGTTLTCRFVYTEGADPHPFETLRAVHETDDGAIEVQYAPEAGGFWYHADAGSYLENLLYPGGEAKPGDIVMSEFVVKCASLTKASASIAAD